MKKAWTAIMVGALVGGCWGELEPRDNPLDPEVPSPVTLEVEPLDDFQFRVIARLNGLEKHPLLAGETFTLRRRILSSACTEQGGSPGCEKPEQLWVGRNLSTDMVNHSDSLPIMSGGGSRKLVYDISTPTRVWATVEKSLADDLDEDGSVADDCNDLDSLVQSCGAHGECDFERGVCVCPAAFTGPNCDECADERFAGANCEECANERFSGPRCTQCFPGFTGERCDECADSRFSGTNCDECADERFKGASCDECADERFAGMSCDECSARFTGPACSHCSERFTGPSCNDCADQRFTGAGCTECADERFSGVNCDECSVRFTGPGCSLCSERFSGANCDECIDERFTGPSCDECADERFTGPNCDECAARFSGPGCSQCAERFAGANCDECVDEKFTGVACDECVDKRFAGENCDECAPGFAGPNCSIARWANWPMPNSPPEGPNTQSYSFQGDIVRDVVTGLSWQRNIPSDSFDQPQAVAYCAGLVLGGLAGWRLPGRIELVSIVDTRKYSPSIDSAAFPGTPKERFWSSSRSANVQGAWCVDFDTGSTNIATMVERLRVRCVR